MLFLLDVAQNIYGLLLVLLICIALFVNSYLTLFDMVRITRYFSNMHSFRLYIASLTVFTAITILFWVMDVHINELPDPVIAYILYVLILTVAFGFKHAFFTGLFSFLLVDYYLFEPRYHFLTAHDSVSIISSLIGFLVTLFIGVQIRNYQEKLIKKNTDLRQLLKARNRFAAITAHDLKNPISTIKLYTQILSKQPARDRADNLLTQSAVTINREADKLLSMIDLLLDFSKLESGKLALKKETCNIRELCKEKIDAMQSLHPNHTYEFICHLHAAVVTGDKLALERVLINLLTNATKYSTPKTKITLEIKKDLDEFIIAIKDQGRGIPLKYQKRLFEPFFQTSESNQGLGLGLYIVKSIIELHKGTIWLDSKRDKGSTFYISLPAKR